MAKITVIRTNNKFTMYKQVARRKGRGSKFQWNAKAQYVITYTGNHFVRSEDYPDKVFKSFEEADKEWVYLTLRY
jgi:hypothetical protein